MSGHFGAPEAVASLASEVWEALLAREPYYAAKTGRSIERIPRGTLAEAEAVASEARARLRRLDSIDQGSLSRSERLTARYLASVLREEIEEPDRWWTSFGVAPYTLSAQSLLPELVFRRLPLQTTADCERYLSLLDDLAASIEAWRERIRAQAEQLWHIPRPALAGVRATLERLGASFGTSLVPSEDRAPERIRQRIGLALEQCIAPAFGKLIEELGAEYESQAPDTVGLGQFPQGPEAYARWVRYHLSSEADPDHIHAIGLEEVDRLRMAMAELRNTAFGWNGSEVEFHTRLRSDSRAKAATPEALEQTYRKHLVRMEALLPTLIRQLPRARASLCRLSPTLEVGMTFGYYDPPTAARDFGIYYYSGYGLEDRLQMNAAPLMFHELVPGHHVQIARQFENTLLPDIRRHTFPFSSFTEGWAEYSAGLAEELGAYSDPYDLYGWLAHQRFAAQRLVVDTGLNWRGWSLSQAREYMAANTLETAPQIASETIRYSTDLPGQALAYRMGFLKFRALRKEAEQRLGNEFELTEFHEAILSEGSLPPAVLQSSLTEWATLRAAGH